MKLSLRYPRGRGSVGGSAGERERAWAVTIAAGVDQKLSLQLSGTSVTILLNGVTVGSFSYNGDLVDGAVGLFSRSGTVSFDNTRSQVGTHVINAVDPTPPTLTPPADVVQPTDFNKATAVVSDSTIGNPIASDNVQIQSVVRTGVPTGNVFQIGTTTITWTATDVFGNVTVKTQKITVVDTQRPTLTVPANVAIRVPNGTTSVFVSDAQIGSATATDNTGAVTVTRSGVPAGNLFPIGTTTITYTATDQYGNKTIVTQTITVQYTAITFSVPAAQTSNEGSTVTFNLGSFTGGGGSWTATVNWGDGTTSTFVTQPGAISAAHTYANDRALPYAVTVTLVDASGNSASGSFTVTVANLPPTVRINTPGPGSNLAWKTAYSFKATLADAGKADTHTCTINWGDGTTSTGTVTESAGAGTCASSHAWSSTGNFTITVTVKDSSGATATATSAITVTKTGGTVFTLLSVKKTSTSKAAKLKVHKKAAKKTHRLKGKR